MRAVARLIGATLLFSTAAVAANLSSVSRGRAIAERSGCLSCHGPQLAGRALLDDPTIATLWSSNLTRVMPRYSDAQLDRTIRTAIRPDGSHLWQMTAAYAALTPADMRDLIAFLRSVPATSEDHGHIRIGPRFLRAAKAGRFQPETIEQARDTAVPPDLGPKFARGRYLARTICAGCHYPSLNGRPDPAAGDAPNLKVAVAYDRDQFRALLRTGKAIGGREVGVMSEESRKRFGGLSDADVDAIRAYLIERARR